MAASKIDIHEVMKKYGSFDSFANNEVLLNKKKNRLPAMGWNSWNAFGSGNTEELTKIMAGRFEELGLDKLGYEYLVLDDGCYNSERVDGKLSNEVVKFPSGFKSLSDYIHSKGLKFGMYNDIGDHLCAGAYVGTCGHEMEDAKQYIEWGVDFIKVDNCYYLFDNATFSDICNARYTFAPQIKSVTLKSEDNTFELNAEDGILRGNGATLEENGAKNIGTFDGTGPFHSPVGMRSGELVFEVEVAQDGEYSCTLDYVPGAREGIGNWLQIAVGTGKNTNMFYDDFLDAEFEKELEALKEKETLAKEENPEAEVKLVEEFLEKQIVKKSKEIKVTLNKGKNLVRFMNHRRQENTLNSYAALFDGLQQAKPDNDVIFSICEWGKTQPQNWGYKVGDSWRILNDITFQVGSDGNPGVGNWESDYTTSVTAQYNKAVIMDEYAGLDKGWNDPDMLMIGMNGLTMEMNKTHMAMWCMMNSPLMLGMDLRRIEKGDDIWHIISNKDLIDLNQDALGVQAKRIFSTLERENPDTEYIRNNERADILVKPLSDGSVAISFINLSQNKQSGELSVNSVDIVKWIGSKMVGKDSFVTAIAFEVKDLWTKETYLKNKNIFHVDYLEPCQNITIKVTPVLWNV